MTAISSKNIAGEVRGQVGQSIYSLLHIVLDVT